MDFDWARVFASLPKLKLINLSEMDHASTHIVAALEAAAKYCPKLESLTLPYAEKGVSVEKMWIVLKKLFAGLQQWRVKENIGGIRHLNVPIRTRDDPFRESEEFFENVMTNCPQLEYLDGYKMSLCTENRLTCTDIWLLKLCDWERFNATCTKLREFHWVVVPFGDPYFRVFGEHLKPQLKKLSFAVAMNWNWRWYFYDTSEAAGDIPNGDWEQKNYSERPGYGFLASDVSAALKSCPLLDELEIQLYHPKELGFEQRFALYDLDEVYDDIPEHEMINANVFDDHFCETLVGCCPLISRFAIIEVAEQCNSENMKPIETFTDRGLMALSRLPFLHSLQLRSVNCTGKGVLEFLNSLSDDIMGNRVFEIAIGDSGSTLTFYDALKELLSEIAEMSELPFERQKFVLRLVNCSYSSRGFVSEEWSSEYLNDLGKLTFRVREAHPTLRQVVVIMWREEGDSFKRIAEFCLHSVLARADVYSGWGTYEVKQENNNGIMMMDRVDIYGDSDLRFLKSIQCSHPLCSPLKMMISTAKDLDARLRALRASTQAEEADWQDQGRKLYELEEKFLRDTLLEGNLLTGWGEPRTAPVRFRNAGVRKRKRERQEAAAERTGKPLTPSTPTLSVDEQLKVDRHRLASYSSVQSPAEPLYSTLAERERKLMEARSKKKKLQPTVIPK